MLRKNSCSLVVVSALHVPGVVENVSESPLSVVAETVVNVQLNPSCATSNETEPISFRFSTTSKTRPVM